MEKDSSLANNEAIVFWVIWFPAFEHKSRFDSIENPISGKINDPVVNEKAKGKSRFKKSYYKLTKQYHDNANIPISIEFVNDTQDHIVIGDDIVNCNIILKYTTNDTQEEKKISLNYLQNSANGLFLYECKSDSFQTIEHIEKHATAYHIKKICHLHLFHGNDSAKADYNDYYFKIFSSREKPDIHKDNNDAIKYYLKSFCDRYNRHVAFFEQFMCPLKDIRDPKRNLSTLIEERKNNANVALGLGIIDKASVARDNNTKTVEIFDGQEYDKDKLLVEYNKLTEDQKQEIAKSANFLNNQILTPVQKEPVPTISEKFDNKKKYEESIFAVGETLYINTLRYSKYLKPKTDDDVRKYLLNLRNLTKVLYFVRDYYRYKHEEKENKKSLKITQWLAGLGFGVSLITFACGLWYAIYSSNGSTKLFDETEKLIKQENTEILRQLRFNNSSLVIPQEKPSNKK
ncbi:MAG: hypothetical protein FWD60_01460 [Candidatus Azobacteroides sp.]|nr:hypothetical protein [Candidatus Azobacteroides sp.]